VNNILAYVDVCNYGYIVCTNEFFDVQLYFFICKNLVVTGNINVLVTGTNLPVTGNRTMPATSNVTSDSIPVMGSLPVTDKPKRPVTTKHFCSSGRHYQVSIPTKERYGTLP
jgi:hypothetical protein